MKLIKVIMYMSILICASFSIDHYESNFIWQSVDYLVAWGIISFLYVIEGHLSKLS